MHPFGDQPGTVFLDPTEGEDAKDGFRGAGDRFGDAFEGTGGNFAVDEIDRTDIVEGIDNKPGRGFLPLEKILDEQ